MIRVALTKLCQRGASRFQLDVNINLDPAVRRAVFFGPSGSGKTLTMRCVAGLETPDKGEIEVDCRCFYSSERGIRLPPRIRRVGYTPQDYALFPHLTVLQNVAYPRSGLFCKYVSPEEKQRARALLKKFAILDLENHLPGEISGGQKQRTALARAANASPRLLLLDEPFSALDPLLRERTRREILTRLADLDVPAIIITHDPEDVDAFAGALVLYNRGRAVQIDDYQARRARFDDAFACLRALREAAFPDAED